MSCARKTVSPGEWIETSDIALRPLRLSDCTPAYLSWLRDPEVSFFLDTRWAEQTMTSIRRFVRETTARDDSHLLAIIKKSDRLHIGNLKIGPVHPVYDCADLSYFIGDKKEWNKGYATQAIRLAVSLAFETLDLHRLQAGVHEANPASAKALERAGFRLEGRFRKQLRTTRKDTWQDHLWYGILREEWACTREFP